MLLYFTQVGYWVLIALTDHAISDRPRLSRLSGWPLRLRRFGSELTETHNWT